MSITRGWSLCLVALCAACGPMVAYEVDFHGIKRQVGPVGAIVVSSATGQEAQRRSLVMVPHVMPFVGRRGGISLLHELLRQADAAGALLVADITIYSVAMRGSQLTECHIAFAPEKFTEVRTIPGRHEMILAERPVTHTELVSKQECKYVTRLEQRSDIDYETKCRPVTRSVMRTRTVYRYESFGSGPGRTVPHQETYLDSVTETECQHERVVRRRTEPVSTYECHHRLQPESVTRSETHAETHYVPPVDERVVRRRLRALPTECVEVQASAPPERRRSRVEAQFYKRRPRANVEQ